MLSLATVSETLLSVSALHQPFYISICISTLPTQHTTFITHRLPTWFSLATKALGHTQLALHGLLTPLYLGSTKGSIEHVLTALVFMSLVKTVLYLLTDAMSCVHKSII